MPRLQDANGGREAFEVADITRRDVLDAMDEHHGGDGGIVDLFASAASGTGGRPRAAAM